MKSPFMNSAAVLAFEPLQTPALVIVCEVVDASVETHCHLADEVPAPCFESAALVDAMFVETGSLDWVNSVVSELDAVPAPVPQPTYAPVEEL